MAGRWWQTAQYLDLLRTTAWLRGSAMVLIESGSMSTKYLRKASRSVSCINSTLRVFSFVFFASTQLNSSSLRGCQELGKLCGTSLRGLAHVIQAHGGPQAESCRIPCILARAYGFFLLGLSSSLQLVVELHHLLLCRARACASTSKARTAWHVLCRADFAPNT